MTAIRPGDAKRFVESGCRKTPLILVYGPDEGSVRSRVRAIVAAVMGRGDDPLGRVDLEAEALNKDPARLLDEANAIGLFGDSRVLIVANAGRLQKGVWQPLVDVPPTGSTVVFQGDDLAKSAPLRLALEKNPDCAALACYPPSRQELQEIIDIRAREAGLSITPAARSYLAELLGVDLALSEGEIEKLVLYCQGRLAIEVSDIDAMIADSSSLAGSEPIDRAFEGQLEDVEAIALRSFREGISPAGLLVLAINHAMLLRKLSLARHEGTLDGALRNERVFFRRIDRVRAQAMRWDVPNLTKALDILAQAQDQTRRIPALEETITIRALWSIALASRRR